jgi:hypothetical protein
MGNTVVRKPGEYTTLCGLALVEVLNEVLPEGVLVPVTGAGDVGDALVRDKRVGKIMFTGSVKTGNPDTGQPGYFYPKTLVTDIDNDAPLVQEEQFGPALPIIRYTDLEQAIEWANAVDVGLGANLSSLTVPCVAPTVHCSHQPAEFHPSPPCGPAVGNGAARVTRFRSEEKKLIFTERIRGAPHPWDSSSGSAPSAVAQSALAGSISVKWSPNVSTRLARPPAAVAAATYRSL